MAPRRYAATAAPISRRRAKFASNCSRTASKPGATTPVDHVIDQARKGPLRPLDLAHSATRYAPNAAHRPIDGAPKGEHQRPDEHQDHWTEAEQCLLDWNAGDVGEHEGKPIPQGLSGGERQVGSACDGSPRLPRQMLGRTRVLRSAPSSTGRRNPEVNRLHNASAPPGAPRGDRPWDRCSPRRSHSQRGAGVPSPRWLCDRRGLRRSHGRSPRGAPGGADALCNRLTSGFRRPVELGALRSTLVRPSICLGKRGEPSQADPTCRSPPLRPWGIGFPSCSPTSPAFQSRRHCSASVQ